MIRRLFARLTGEPKRGAGLFALAVAQARQQHWFIEGKAPDSTDGRFAVLASVVALITLRLERSGQPGETASIALTERFVEAMDIELRQMGLGDPALGKQVRALVGAVALRLGRFRNVLAGQEEWAPVVIRSVFRDSPPDDASVEHCEAALKHLWERLSETQDSELFEGRLA